MDLPVFDPIEYDFDTERLRRLVEDYKERVSSGLKSGMTLVEMESEWSKLIRDTKEIYSQISGKLIEDAEDSDFIRKKKQSTESDTESTSSTTEKPQSNS